MHSPTTPSTTGPSLNRLPVAVRIESGYMEPTDLKSNRLASLPGGCLSLGNMD